MDQPILLWIDLTEAQREPAPPGDAHKYCVIHRVRGYDGVGARIRSVNPDVLCFDFDIPDSADLVLLSQVKCEHPRIPILMLTVYHSEALAVWALRARVWDYIVKPFSADDVLRSMRSLFSESRRVERRSPREIIFPHQKLVTLDEPSTHDKAVLDAQVYIARHLHQKLSLSEVANRCGMSPSHFSRIFARIRGMNFSEFVLRTRVRQAVRLLGHCDATVTRVCYDVGFRDVSYFGRVFRRYTRMTPSQYRQACLNNAHLAARLDAELDLDRLESQYQPPR